LVTGAVPGSSCKLIACDVDGLVLLHDTNDYIIEDCVFRGGGFEDSADFCRSAVRDSEKSHAQTPRQDYGLRMVLAPAGLYKGRRKSK